MESKSKGFPSIKFPSSVLREAFDIFFSSTYINKTSPDRRAFGVESKAEKQSFNDMERFFTEYDKSIVLAVFSYRYFLDKAACFEWRYSESTTNITVELEGSREIVDKIFAIFESYYEKHKPVEKKEQRTEGVPMKKFKELPYSFWKNPAKVFETMQKMDKAGQFLELQKFKADLEQFKEERMSKKECTRFEGEMTKLQNKATKKTGLSRSLLKFDSGS
jgi:hypothetical protein